MARTSFTGPVKSTNGFEGNVVGAVAGSVNLGTTGTLTTATPTDAAVAANFSATKYITIVGQDGNTYYVPVAAAAW
jgi:hypothetical protein